MGKVWKIKFFRYYSLSFFYSSHCGNSNIFLFFSFLEFPILLKKYKQILTVEAVTILSVQCYFRRQTNGYMTAGHVTLVTIDIDGGP